MRRYLFALFLTGIAFAWLITALRAEDLLTERLQALKLDPTPEGVEKYLRSLIPSADAESRIRSQIKNLGSSNYEERQSAMMALLNMPIPPIEFLEEAALSSDAEVRSRTRRILARANLQAYKTRLIAVFNFVEHRKIKGLAPVVVQLLPQLREPHLFQFAERALEATARYEDAELLRRELSEAPSPRREAALLALAKALGPEALPELMPLLKHAESSLRLAAAEALADQGQRECLPVLIDLLESPVALQRHRSVIVLRAVTGQRFGFSPTAEEKSRAQAVAAWRNWQKEHGETARLIFPLPRKPIEQGRTLVCVWGSRLFMEVLENKGEVFSVAGFKCVWGCHGTPEGRRFVADAEQQAVFEYDSKGREIWSRTDLPGRPTSVEGLENGNVLVACSDSDRVVEIAPDGRLVWNFQIEGRPTTAQRLSSGHTIINLQNAGKVVEVDQQGNIVELVKGLDRSHTAQQLDNGNVLVTEMRLNRVDEYDLNGNIVWTHGGLKNPAQAQRLSNGNTLIADEDGLHEFDPENNRIWHLETTRARFFRY